MQFGDLRQFQELTAFKMGVTPVKDCKDPFKRTEGGVAVLLLLGLSNCFLRSYVCHFLVTWQVLILAEREYLYTQSPCVAEPHACACVPVSVRVAEPLPVFVSVPFSVVVGVRGRQRN